MAKRHMAGEDRAWGTESTKIREGARQSPKVLAAAERKHDAFLHLGGEWNRGRVPEFGAVVRRSDLLGSNTSSSD